MKYFYLAHNELSLNCLKVLIERGYKPDFVVIHKDYEYEKCKKNFYVPIERFTEQNKIKLYRVNSISKIQKSIAKSEIGICVGFMEILKEEIFSLPKFGIFNIHCGQLPLYRGRAPISRALINGENNITLTLHKIDEGVDSGDIYLEEDINITNKDDVNTLYQKCSAISPFLIMELLKKLARGTIKGNKQIINENSKPSRIISEDERKINWNNNIINIHNLIRGLSFPYPGAYTFYYDEKYIINKAKIIEQFVGLMVNPGIIMKVSKNFMLIKCATGILRISGIVKENYEKVSLIDTFKEKERLM